MADDYDPHNISDISDRPEDSQVKEDAETAATRKELKHAAISEQPVQPIKEADDSSSSGNDKTPPPIKTPEDAQSHALRDQIGSPKKKRAISEVETDSKEEVADTSLAAVASSAASPPPGSRTTRSEPEKKRPRDEGSISVHSNEGHDAKAVAKHKRGSKSISTDPLVAPKRFRENNEMAVTSDEAFKKSGFSSLSSAVSPFAAAGPVKSVFGGSAARNSPFGDPAPTSKSFFGGGAAALSAEPTASLSLSNTSSVSPFGTANGSTGSGSGFASGLGSGAKKLSSFATPGQPSLSQEKKTVKDFGAPESEGDGEGQDDASGEEEEKDEATTVAEKEGSQPPTDDKKKHKLQKVQVDDGETGEATLVSVRAKIYALDKMTNNWKERGTGYLKVNAPVTSVELDRKGMPVPGSFDASTLGETKNAQSEAGSGKGPRLIMRQDHTHRVILNTAVVPAMSFNKRDSLKAAHLIFQAFEESGVSTLQLKMSTVNGKDFLKEVDAIKRELSA